MMKIGDEIALVVAVLEHPAGLDLSFAAIHGIRSTNRTIEVEWEDENKKHVKSFPLENKLEAATFFINKRHQLQYGIDYEDFDLHSK